MRHSAIRLALVTVALGSAACSGSGANGRTSDGGSSSGASSSSNGGENSGGGGQSGAGAMGASSANGGASGTHSGGGSSGGKANGGGGAKGTGGGANASGGGGTSSGGGANGGATSTGGSATGGSGTVVTYGQPYDGGQYNLGPVDYSESEWHNACAPSTKYPASVQAVEGDLLAGLWNGIPNTAGYCDACIYVTTPTGKSALLRVVTYGDTTQNSIDVSQTAYDILNTGEYPRTMTWQFAECPDTGNMMYEFQTGSSEYWTSFWLRNARVPLTKVEVQSANHSSYVELTRGSDGTLTDAGGFGQGSFSIRSTGMDGQQVIDTFAWPSAGIAGQMLTGQENFK